uniref:GST N-terminal domain-containing protein n=1 Tax=Zea mays TaxID=4577 RepID=A0A804P1S7_MAIZE
MSLLSSASFLRLRRKRRAHALAPRRHAQPHRPRLHRQPLQDGIGCHPPRHGEKRVTAFARKIDLARSWDPLPNPRPPESSAGAAGSCDPWQGTFLGSRVHRRRSALVSPPTTPRCCRHGLLIDACYVHGLMRARQMTARSALDEVTYTGDFDRSPSTFRSSVSRDGRFPTVTAHVNGLATKVEKSRKQMKERKNRVTKIRGVKKTKAGDAKKKGGSYLPCHFSHHRLWHTTRCLAFLKLKGLDHAIGVTVVKPIFERTKESDEHLGWVFPAAADEEPGAEPNPLNDARSVRELYEIASSNYAGKPTIPVLWDKQLKTVVNNESSEIIRMLNAEFNGIARNPGLDL